MVLHYRFLTPINPQTAAPLTRRVHIVHVWLHCAARTFCSFLFFVKKSVLRDYAAEPFGCLECLKSGLRMYCVLPRSISLGISSEARIRGQKKRVIIPCMQHACDFFFFFHRSKSSLSLNVWLLSVRGVCVIPAPIGHIQISKPE